MSSSSEVTTNLDIEKIRKEFPILSRQVNGQPLVYLDNAATTQKPICVLQAEAEYYRLNNANIHRGVHALSEAATANYEAVREKIRKHINAVRTEEIIFVRGATEGINLIAQSLGGTILTPGDEVLITEMEHHSNIVPWQIICQRTGAILRYIPIDDVGDLCMEKLDSLLTEKTKIVALTHVSNALGTVNPIEEIIRKAHAVDAKVVVDGAQFVPHMRVDVRALDCDFYVFSGHKLFAPTGIGVMYGKYDILDAMPPYHGGGDMIKRVSLAKTEYNDLPYKFEAGTPHIAGTIGLGFAIDYLNSIGLDNICEYEAKLLVYVEHKAESVEGLKQIGQAKRRVGVFSFILDKVHPHDIGTILNDAGIAIRAGHHCAMPIMERFGIPATARASFALYNTYAEVDYFFEALGRCQEIFS